MAVLSCISFKHASVPSVELYIFWTRHMAALSLYRVNMPIASIALFILWTGTLAVLRRIL